ncbi:hypothetical protein M5K25_021885 [Dendrobium thyrsiflorum]|uniref:Uncharacterized protein n=1 Tax=Dendrobium thyrsiflorum TaxID=117978 RepID=A0ABD0U5A2_DENTH
MAAGDLDDVGKGVIGIGSGGRARAPGVSAVGCEEPKNFRLLCLVLTTRMGERSRSCREKSGKRSRIRAGLRRYTRYEAGFLAGFMGSGGYERSTILRSIIKLKYEAVQLYISQKKNKVKYVY